MTKQDIKELRKMMKKDDGIVDWVYGLYVDPDNQPAYEHVGKMADLDDAERFRHQNIFAKVMSPRLGRDAFPTSVPRHAEDLLALRSAGGLETEEFAEFRDRLLAEYSHTDPYYAILARVVYDVPNKAKDGRHLEDGEQVYEALLFSICPATLSKPMLGFEKEQVAELGRRWQIGNPMSGFLYPAFSDRMEDRNEVMIRSVHPEQEDFILNYFGVDAEKSPVGVKTQQDIFQTMLGQMDVDLEIAAAISENIVERAAEEESAPLMISDVKKMTEAAGFEMPEELLDEIFEDTVGETPITLSAIAEPYVTVKTDSVTIKVPANKASLITSRNIDGRDYILIPADGTVTVNGVAVSAGVAVPVQTAVQSDKLKAAVSAGADFDGSQGDDSMVSDFAGSDSYQAEADEYEETDASSSSGSEFVSPEDYAGADDFDIPDDF